MESLAAIPAIAIQEKFIEVGGCRVRYLQAGSGPPLVMVPGLAGYSFCFRRNIAALAQTRSVYALDLPGTGFTECPENLDGRLRNLAQLLLDFWRALDLGKPALLGSSHGGAVVLVAAAMAREQGMEIGPLVLAAPVNPWARNGARRAELMGHPASVALLRMAAPLLPALHGFFLRRLYGDPRRVSADTLAGYSAGLRDAAKIRPLLSRVAHWRKDLGELEIVIPKCADSPALLVWGGRDRAVAPGSAAALMRALPRARLAVLPEAGHLAFEEDPEIFNSIVLEFLKDHC